MPPDGLLAVELAFMQESKHDWATKYRFRSVRSLYRDRGETGGAQAYRVFLLLFSDRGWGVEWILRLAAAGGEGPCVDIMEIGKPDGLGDIADLGLTLAEAKQLLARVQCEISTAQAKEHAVRRPAAAMEFAG